MSKPAVSVCIPSYNHANYIGRTIESVLAQDFQDLEIVITDDASTDDTVGEVLRFSDPRIRLFRHDRNQGPSIAANNNIRNARGDFICLLPSDDLYEPTKVGKQIRLLRARPEVGAVFSHMHYVGEDGQPIAREANQMARPRDMSRVAALRNFFFEGNCLAAPTAMIRREIFDVIGDFDPRLLQTQDFDFWIRLCLRYEIALIEEPLVGYRIRDQLANMDANTPGKVARIHWELPRILENFLGWSDVALLQEVFPETKQSIGQGLAPASALAVLALSQPHPWIRAFGVEALYRALGNAREAAILEAMGYGYPRFFQVLAENDPTRAALVDQMQSRRQAESAAVREEMQRAYSDVEERALRAEAGLEEIRAYLRQVEEARDWFRDQSERWEAEARRLAGA